MIQVAVLDDYQRVALTSADWGALPKETQVQVFSDHLSDPEALVQRLLPFAVVVLMRERTPFPARLIQRLPNLRLLVTTGMNNAAVDVQAAKDRGVVVCGTTGAGGVPHPTAELAWGLMLALARNIVREDAAVRANRWQTTMGRHLAGNVLGILGLGQLGAKMAVYGNAFGMKTVAWSHNLTPEKAAEHNVRYVERDELFRTADFITVHMKLSARTRGLVGAKELAMMRPQAYLVNTSRGPIVDEGALVTALRERRIAGAGLDTFDQEPLPPGHPLLSLDNVILTPHIGYVIERTYQSWYRQAIENIGAFLAGKPVRVIDQPAGYDSGIELKG